MTQTKEAGRDVGSRTSFRDVFVGTIDRPGHSLTAIAVQPAFDRDAVRALVVIRLARQHGLTLNAAATIASLAGLGPNEGGRR